MEAKRKEDSGPVSGIPDCGVCPKNPRVSSMSKELREGDGGGGRWHRKGGWKEQ